MNIVGDMLQKFSNSEKGNFIRITVDIYPNKRGPLEPVEPVEPIIPALPAPDPVPAQPAPVPAQPEPDEFHDNSDSDFVPKKSKIRVEPRIKKRGKPLSALEKSILNGEYAINSNCSISRAEKIGKRLNRPIGTIRSYFRRKKASQIRESESQEY